MNDIINKLNAKTKQERLDALKEVMDLIKKEEIKVVKAENDVNNHIHTTYSFSPYSPTCAVFKAVEAGLCTAGIMDHDSIYGAEEFIEAGKIANLPITIGVEFRTDFKNTPFKDKTINNPDQKGVAYITLHGVPHTRIEAVKAFMKPYYDKRNIRNEQMTKKLNDLVTPFGVSLDFEKDVKPISNYSENGQITERHILYALSINIVNALGKGKLVVNFLEKLQINVPEKIKALLEDKENAFYLYDLLGVLKSSLVEQFYIDATDECMDITIASKFANENGIVCSYAYLGDVKSSVTGDKKEQKFEDDYLDELFESLKSLGFKAVSYMPSRNTAEQLNRVRNLCDKYELMQISGEDINQPRQKFVCEAMKDPVFENLYYTTWALIGHEISATENIEDGMFSEKTISKMKSLDERIKHYYNVAKNYYK